jgi:Icc-related predicted phosphoesterase
MRLLVLGDFQGRFSVKLLKKLKNEEFDYIIGLGDYAGIKDFMPYVYYSLSQSKKGEKAKSPKEFFGKKKFKEILKKDNKYARNVMKNLDSLGKVIAIWGNGDDEWYKCKFIKGYPDINKSNKNFIKNLKNTKNITYGKTKLNEINIIGYGGYMDIEAFFKMDKKDYNGKDHTRRNRLEKARKYFFERNDKIKGDRIFLFHYPPMGVFDIIKSNKANPMNGKSAGVRFFREAINKYKPKLVLCGHMHEYQGMKKLYNVPVINPGDAEKDKYAIVDIDEKTWDVKTKFIK